MESHHPRATTHNALMRYARMLGFGEIHTCIDSKIGMHAIIAVHSTKLGPAIGGCRFFEYDATGPALKDALRLAYMMTLKAAVSNLPHGGAKSVIIKPKKLINREKLFQRFGDFVHELNGRYIAAVDVGTNEQDMDSIAASTSYVIGASKAHKGEGDPSPYTATGILRGIQAAVKYKLNRDNLEGVHVAMQGAGRVAYHLAKQLHQLGARLTVCDLQQTATDKMRDEFGAKIVSTKEIFDVPCDVFSPCALGGVINADSIQRLQTTIIAGAANNQLAHHKFGRILHQKGVLYAPDFVINSGGLIYAASLYDYHDEEPAKIKINQLYDTLSALYERADLENRPTTQIAETLAIEKLRSFDENI